MNNIQELRTSLRKSLISDNKEFLKDKSFMEFGVWKGSSLSEIYDMYNDMIINNETIFYGYDSFLGLPEEVLDKNNPSYWTKELFSLNGVVPEILNNERIKIVKGFFSESLTDEFASTLTQKIGLLHIDCDIYTSTYDVLDFCFKNDLLVKGSIIMYDDWGGYLEKLGPGHEFEAGEGLAHVDIMKKYNRECTYKHKEVLDAASHYEVAVFILQ